MNYRVQTAKYLAFLDIDGVFTSARAQFASANNADLWNVFDPVGVAFMNRLHDRVDSLKFVLISTWKENLYMTENMNIHWITTAFRNAGFRGDFYEPWKTNPDNNSKFYKVWQSRSNEIKEYLELYASEIKDYIIFDDNDYNFNQVLGKKRHIRTDSDNGIQLRHMKDAMSLIGSWDTK